MSSLLKFDEINKLNNYIDAQIEKNQVALDLEKSFKSMGITDEQKQARINTALRLQDLMLAFFMLVKLQREMGLVDKAYQTEYLKQKYTQIVEEETRRKADENMQSQIDKRSSDIVETTDKNLNKEDQEIQDLIDEGLLPEDMSDDEIDRIRKASWWLSILRAGSIASDESNGVWNYEELTQAIMDGHTMKEWCDMKDKRERQTHLQVGGTVIPISDPFIVGDYYMMFPGDASAGPEELCGCRCWLEFI